MDGRQSIFDVYACFGQFGIVERGKSVKFFGIAFGGAIATHQFVFEKQTHFGHACIAKFVFGRRQLDGGYQIFFGVAAQHAHRQLCACKDNRFRQIFEHKTERRCRISHGVGAVQHDETVEMVVIVANGFGDARPFVGLHIRRIDERHERHGRDVHMQHLQFGNKTQHLRTIERCKRLCIRIFAHTDGATREYQQNRTFRHHVVYSTVTDFAKLRG